MRLPLPALTLDPRTDRWGTPEWLGVAGACILNFVIRIYRFDFPIIGGWQFRYTQTAWGIRSLMRDGLNPLLMETPVLGPPWRIPFEFPIFQLLAATIGRLGGLDPAHAGRLTASLVFAGGIAAVYALARRLCGITVATTSVVLYGFSAFGLNWGSQLLVDFTAATLGVAFVVALLRHLDGPGSARLILVVVLGTLAILAKSTTGVAWVIVGGTLLVARLPTWPSRARLWLPSIGVPTLVGVAWTRYTDAVKLDNPHAAWLTSNRLNFSGHHFRRPADLVEMDPWRLLLEHALQPAVGGVLIGVGLVIAAWVLADQRRTVGVLTAVMVTGPIAFNGLYLTHDYYFIASFPALCILAAVGIVTIASGIARSPRAAGGAGLGLAMTLALVGLSWTSPEGIENMNMLLTRQRAATVDYSDVTDHTTADDRLIVIGLDWDPTLLYVTDRKGLMLRPEGTRPDSAELGTFYEYVYWAQPNPTPEQWAEYFPAGLRHEEISPNFHRIFPLGD